MMDVVPDELGNVVRVVFPTDDGLETVDLQPEQAEAIGEEMIRLARDVRTAQTTLGSTPGEGQMTLTEGSEDEESLLDEVLSEADDDWDLGDVMNANDPMDW